MRDRRIGFPWAGTWREVLNSDARQYDGAGAGNLGAVVADAEQGWDWLPASGVVTVGAYATLWLAGRYGH